MIRIITDSAADFEPEEIARLGISCVPLSVRFGNAEYQENINLSKEMFYQLLEHESDMPSTSQPSPQAFLSVLQEAQDAGDEAIVITLSSALSGTCQNAFLAKNILEYEQCYIVDSLTATAGERILVEHALKLRSAGQCAKEIASELEALRSRITLYACMDTLL
ncbi:MAG: DegV family protein [Faecousia sp.]